MPTFIYLPVPTSEMKWFAAEWNKGRVAKQKTPYTVLQPAYTGALKSARRGLGFGCLSGVHQGDKLYVLSHGNPLGTTAIGARRGAKSSTDPFGGVTWNGGSMKSYTADRLAEVMEQEGLTHSLIDLRVFACGSGVPLASAQSFAAALKQEMVSLGYHQVQVTGYLGAAHAQYEAHDSDDIPSKSVDRDPTSKQKDVVRAKDRKQVF